MKKLLSHCSLHSPNSNWKCIYNNLNSGPKGFFFSTEANPLVNFFSSPSQTCDALYDRITAAVRHRDSIAPVIDEWVREGRPADIQHLRYIIRGLRKQRHSKYALQVFEWIDKSKSLALTPGDTAIRLDLIGITRGLEAAQKYFHSVPIDLRAEKVYGALLNCYAHQKSVEKAEGVMQKLRDEFVYGHPLAFNIMMKLYYKVGKFEKLHTLAQEMEEKGVILDKFSYYIRLNAYAAVCDVTGMEFLLKKMKADHGMVIDTCCYTIAANGYIRAGDFDKALEAVKQFEHLTRCRRGEGDYDRLLTLYASMGRKADVNRVWNEYNGVGKLANSGYLSMISALEKLDDLDAMEKIVDEWESHKTPFDIRIPNFLITAYCKKGNLRKAEVVIEQVVESGQKVTAGTWSRMALGYCKNKQMEKAVEALKKSILSSPPGAKPMMRLLASCLKYLESQGNFQRAEDIRKLLEKRGMIVEGFWQRLEDCTRKITDNQTKFRHGYADQWGTSQ